VETRAPTAEAAAEAESPADLVATDLPAEAPTELAGTPAKRAPTLPQLPPPYARADGPTEDATTPASEEEEATLAEVPTEEEEEAPTGAKLL